MNTKLLSQFSHPQILVIGDVMLDRYWMGNTDRISPEAPVPVVNVNGLEEQRPGGAANVALNITQLGAKAQLLGLTGQDVQANELENLLKKQNVKCEFSKIPNRATISKLRILSRHQQLIRLDFEQYFEQAETQELLDLYQNALATQSINAIILSDYAKGTLSDPRALIAQANAKKIPVFVDPKNMDFSVYHGATVITPNEKELIAVIGPWKSDAEMVEKSLSLCEQHALGALLVTRGEHGMSLIQPGKSAIHLAACAREVFDVTGAGDTVIAVFALAIAAGANLADAAQWANLAAGIVVAKVGTASIQLHELQKAAMPITQNTSAVLTEEALLACVREAKERGERVVMTNGCFDLIHRGHVTYLEQAKQLGDRLIVAVNTDESVKKLKGPSRPLNNVDDRMAVLAGLRSVDWVLPFSESTPQRLIEAVLPHVLVKGGDYEKDAVAGGRAVEANGGRVEILSFVDGCSTTGIIERMSQKTPKTEGVTQ